MASAAAMLIAPYRTRVCERLGLAGLCLSAIRSSLWPHDGVGRTGPLSGRRHDLKYRADGALDSIGTRNADPAVNWLRLTAGIALSRQRMLAA